ncbi:MAG TPA: hypothetical protein VIT21_02520 [Chthoniobacterales bacterium]
MPAYLSQIAAGAALTGSRGTLSPAVRSRSPIAERDQRLTLTDMDWNFEDTLASGTSASETPPPLSMEPATRIEPEAPKKTPANPLPHSSSPNPSIDESPAKRPDSPHQAQRESASDPLRIRHAAINTSSAAASNISRQDPKPLPGNSLASPEPVPEPVEKSGVQAPHPAYGATGYSAQQQRRVPQKAVPATSKADPGTPMIAVNTVPQAGEPTASAHGFPEVSRSEQSQLPELPPLTQRQTARRREPVGPELSPEPARSSVVINHIQVDVVPPAAERSTSKPASTAPPRSVPVSQIGPLRGVAKHLAFSIRHR